MNYRHYLVGLLLAGFLGWSIFGPEDEAPNTGGGSRDSNSGTHIRLLPHEPEPLNTDQRYGIAASGTAHDRAFPYQRRGPYGQHNPGLTTSPPLGAEPHPHALDRFRFRPLTERERQRMALEGRGPSYDDQSHPAPGVPEHYSNRPGYPERTAKPTWPSYGQPLIPTADWPHRGYSFRPYETPPATRSRWRSPYEEGNGRRQPGPADPWSAPQWGSTPRDWSPRGERMYPSLDWWSDRRLTTR